MKKITMTSSSVYRYNLYDEIEGFSAYNDLISDLTTMTERDSVALYINCPGGRVDVGLSIIQSIKNTYASVTAVVEGPSYSMASIIALSCDRLIMLDNTFLMFHNYSTVGYGKGGELMNSMKHSDDHFNKLMSMVCFPFLSKAELTKISKDQDIYIYSDDEMNMEYTGVSIDKRKERHFK